MNQIDESLKKELLELMKKGIIVGFSNELHPKIKNGKIVPDTQCIRVFVEKKLPLVSLSPNEIIPQEIKGVPTDVVERGKIRALQLDPTQNFRPVPIGVSVGNFNITAGTLNIPFYSSTGELVDSSNAHIFAEDPTLPPDAQVERRITQAGPYDLKQRGQNPADWVSHEYLFHYQVIAVSESNCPIGKMIAKVYNSVAELAGARTRLKPTVEAELNHIDAAFAIRKVDCNNLIWNELKLDGRKYIGWLFAGSDQTTVICKVKYALDKWTPYLVEPYEPVVDDILEKWGRTTGHTSGKVTEASATVSVWYGSSKIAIFEDVILTEPMSQGGDSGSPTFRVM